MGRLDEALRDGQIAQELDPNQDHLSDALSRRRDYDGTIAIQRMMLKRHPDDGYLHEYLFETYMVKEMYNEAIQEVQQALRLFGLSESAARVKRALTIAGYRRAIRQVAKECEDLQAAKQAFVLGMLAHFYTISGEKDRAFYWLQQAYDQSGNDRHRWWALLYENGSYLRSTSFRPKLQRFAPPHGVVTLSAFP